MVGITQVCAYRTDGSVKGYVDKNLTSSMTNVKTVSVGEGSGPSWNRNSSSMSNEDRNVQILEAIKVLLGAKESQKASSENSPVKVGV